MPRIYLDHAATTPIRPEAAAAVAEGMRVWANPSSPHAEGRAARAALEDARARIAGPLGWDGHVILTSGASEALAIALGRGAHSRVIASAVEHDAVFRAAPEAQVLGVSDGAVDREQLRAALREGPAMVAVQYVNSEVGTVQPIDEVTREVRDCGSILVVDCAQSAGKMALPDADILIVSAHKLGGPPGIGALLVRDLAMLRPSGGHEYGYRAGTENLPAILGFAAAAERITIAQDGLADWLTREQGLGYSILDLEYPIQCAGGEIVSPGMGGVAIWAIAMPNVSAAAQLIRFDAMGFAVSAGSACSSGTLKRSRALSAFGIDEGTASRTIRVSFGWNTTAAEIESFLAAWLEMASNAVGRAA